MPLFVIFCLHERRQIKSNINVRRASLSISFAFLGNMASNIEVPVFTDTTVWKVAFLRQTSHADTIRDDFLAIIPGAAPSYADFEEKWLSELSWRAVSDVVCRKINGGEENQRFISPALNVERGPPRKNWPHNGSRWSQAQPGEVC